MDQESEIKLLLLYYYYYYYYKELPNVNLLMLYIAQAQKYCLL